MTTTIQPASGQGILFAQQGPGTTPGYAALDVRRSESGSLQEGVYGTSTLVTAGGVSNVGQADFMVTQRAAGANMSIDVNMPAGGFAWVQGDTINGQGLYCVPVHASNINEVIATADATNPRIDQIILEAQDNVLDASGGNIARTRVLTGTPTATASLTNRLGALALPGSALLLADVLVGNGVATLANAVIRDRRKWARGALVRQVKSNGNVSTASGSFVSIDTATLQARVECSGLPVRITFLAMGSNATATDSVATGLNLDGSAIDGFAPLGEAVSAAGGQENNCGYVYETIPAAGSHLFTPTYAAFIGGTATLRATGGYCLTLLIEELVRQNAPNNVVTTG